MAFPSNEDLLALNDFDALYNLLDELFPQKRVDVINRLVQLNKLPELITTENQLVKTSSLNGNGPGLFELFPESVQALLVSVDKMFDIVISAIDNLITIKDKKEYEHFKKRLLSSANERNLWHQFIAFLELTHNSFSFFENYPCLFNRALDILVKHEDSPVYFEQLIEVFPSAKRLTVIEGLKVDFNQVVAPNYFKDFLRLFPDQQISELFAVLNLNYPEYLRSKDANTLIFAMYSASIIPLMYYTSQYITTLQQLKDVSEAIYAPCRLALIFFCEEKLSLNSLSTSTQELKDAYLLSSTIQIYQKIRCHLGDEIDIKDRIINTLNRYKTSLTSPSDSNRMFANPEKILRLINEFATTINSPECKDYLQCLRKEIDRFNCSMNSAKKEYATLLQVIEIHTVALSFSAFQKVKKANNSISSPQVTS